MNNLIQKIANDTMLIRSAPKHKAFESLLSLMNKLENSSGGDEYTQELKTLYPFFMPPIPAKPKKPVDWIKKAMAKNDDRYFLNNWRCIDGQLVATDGHRLHLYTGNHEFNDGAYDKAGTLLDADTAGRFPDYKRVIPDTKKYSLHQLSDFRQEASTGNYPAIKFFLGEKMAFCVNRAYWQAAVSIMDVSEMDIFYDPKHSANTVILEYGDYKAIVMPMRE